MKVLYIVGSIDPADGGAVHVVEGLTRVLTNRGVEITLFAPSWKHKAVCKVHHGGVTTVLFPTDILAKCWAGYSRQLAEALKNKDFNFDLIHTHRIWDYPQFAAYQATKGSAIPIVASVHGELSDGNLKYDALKKKILSVFVQKKILKAASAIHAVSQKEAEAILRFAHHPKISIIPNGVNFKEFTGPFNKEWIKEKYPHIQGKKVILFLGRVSFGKGLNTLIQAFGCVIREIKDVCLIIAGPDNWGYKTILEKIIIRMGVSDKVIFTGMLIGEEKRAAINCADVFVLPSLAEGFSMAVLEAMICGLPVIISHQCNFTEVEMMKAGKIIDVDVDPLANALIEILNNPEESRKMGKRGAKLVKEKYTLDIIADKMLSFYQGLVTRHH